MNAQIQKMIAAANQAATVKATSVAQAAQVKAAEVQAALEVELAEAKATFASAVEDSSPRKIDLLEKAGKLEKVVEQINARITSSEFVIEAKVASLGMISSYVQSCTEAKRDLGTAINASAWAIVKAQLEAKGFREGTKVYNDLKPAMMEKAISSTPEIAALVAVKEDVTKRADKVTKARLNVERDLFKAGKYLQKQVKMLDALDMDVVFASKAIGEVLIELPVYDSWRFDFSRQYNLFSSMVKEAKEKVRASKLARNQKEKAEAAKASVELEVQMKDLCTSNIISLAEAKELQALAAASQKSRNTKVLTQKTFERAKTLCS